MPSTIRHSAFDAGPGAGVPRLTRPKASLTLARMKTARLPIALPLPSAAATYYVYRNARAGPD